MAACATNAGQAPLHTSVIVVYEDAYNPGVTEEFAATFDGEQWTHDAKGVRVRGKYVTSWRMPITDQRAG